MCNNKITPAECGDFIRHGWGGVGYGGTRIDVDRPGVHRRQSGKLWLQLR